MKNVERPEVRETISALEIISVNYKNTEEINLSWFRWFFD